MLVIISIFAAIIPMVSYLLVIWMMDKYEREPLTYVALHFFWGAFGAILFAIIGSTIVSMQMMFIVRDSESLSLLETILVAPFVEEITKGIFLIATVANRKFDNLTDGLVYGGAIGLGFGMTENFMYFLSYGDTLSSLIVLVIIRSGFSAVMHCIATAIFGAFLGITKFSTSKIRFMFPVIGLFIAMFIHFLWNLSVSFENTYILGFLFMLIIIIIFFVVFGLSLSNERKIISRELLDESDTALFPAEHVTILLSKRKNSKGWIAESIRKEYIKLLTRLAFRKMQMKKSTGAKRDFYESEVNTYRSKIRIMLNPNSDLETTTEVL